MLPNKLPRMVKTNEPPHEKSNMFFEHVLHKHKRWLEAGNFAFRKWKNCTILVAKTKALISFAVTAKLICVFVFAYATCWFSHDVTQMWKNKTRLYKLLTPLIHLHDYDRAFH